MARRRQKLSIPAASWLIVKASIKSFAKNRDMEVAATLAFYGFLALMPLLLLVTVCLGVVLGSSDTVPAALQRVLVDLFPTFHLGVLDDLAAISFKGVVGLVSVLLLLWCMTPLAGALRSALAEMFKLPIRMHFIKSKLIDLGTIIALLLVLVLLTALKLFLPEVEAGGGVLSRVAFFAARTLFPFLLSVGLVGLFFRVFSPIRLAWRQWLLGAVTVAVLWGLMRHVFLSFMQINPNYGYAFGSLKAVFLLVVWVYYSFAALLLGAEIMANTHRREAILLRELLDDGLDDEKAGNRLAGNFELRLEAGETLFREGDPGHEMYVVLEGAVRLLRGERELAVMRRGSYFGEMSLLGGNPRSATAVAADAVRLAVITQANFDLLVRENPALVRTLLEELARRLERTNALSVAGDGPGDDG